MTTQAGDARLAGWWRFMGAHALLVQRVGRDLAAATSLPLGSYNVLRLLHEARGGRLRLSELARAVHLTRSGVTRLVNRLESCTPQTSTLTSRRRGLDRTEASPKRR